MADFKKAKQEAKKVLDENYVTEPPVDVVEIAKNYGYSVVEAELPKNVAGFVDPKGDVIYVNLFDSDQRKTFTVAHELGHIILHTQDLEENPDLGILFRRPLGGADPDPKEQEANCFAANLLVPQNLLEDKSRRYSGLVNSKVLAALFGVSKEVIEYRLKDIQNGR